MFFHVPDQGSQAPPSMVGSAFIVNVAENALDRIGLRAIARQPNQFETGMLFQPAVDRFRLMNLVIVANDINLSIALPADLLKVIQQFAEKGVVFLRPQDVIRFAQSPDRAPPPDSASDSCPGSGLQVARL